MWGKNSPSVVLGIEKKVCTHNGDTHSHNAQDNQDQHHEAIHIVDFVGPERCEDEVPVTWGQKQKTLQHGCLDHFKQSPSVTLQYTYISMKMEPKGRIPPRHTMTAGSMNLRAQNSTYWRGRVSLSVRVRVPLQGKDTWQIVLRMREGGKVDRLEIQVESDNGLRSHLPFPFGSKPQCLAERCKC